MKVLGVSFTSNIYYIEGLQALMSSRFQCIDCDEITIHAERHGRIPICLTCGAVLMKLPPVPRTERDQRAESLDDLFELFGGLRDSIMDAISQSQPTRQISVSYLNTLGKVVVDDKKTILRDISLNIGPLHILAVSAHFGHLPEDSKAFSNAIVCGNPVCGEASLTNQSKCHGAMVLLDRGVVSFASKCMRAIEAGASAVVIAQTAGVWPFVMADSARELQKAGVEVAIPVVMISAKDAELVRKMIDEQEQHASTRPLPSATASLPATGENASSASNAVTPAAHVHKFDTVLKFGQAVHECSICQDEFAVGNSVLKLPCRHVYHTDCVINWLATNNTCPLCRLELPKEVEGQKLPSRGAPQGAVDPSRMYYN